MSSRGGRERQWKEYPLRPEEKIHHGRNTVPPSRHLWVGNLSHTLTERALSNHFRQFGELESVAFSPGRSYAFINFIEASAAFAAFGALQGFILAGNALRIEFAKAEKSSAQLHEEDDYIRRRDSPRSSVRESPFPHRDSRIRHSNSDPNNENQKPISSGSRADGEPNEVLWIGFPQSLKLDEHSFWDAFSPFGEIEKISSYPGRTYAFVRYKHVNSAIRAKDNLQGKLFGNPRVHITFARSESRAPPSNTGKNSIPDPPSPRYGRQHDRYHDERKRRSPLPGRNHGFRDTGHDGYGRRSPSRDRNVNFHDFHTPRRGPVYDDEWDLPEDALIFHGAKKLKGGPIPIPIPVPVPSEPELPEYPFSDSEHGKNVLSRPPGFDNNNLGHFGYHKQMIHDPPMNVAQPYGERGNIQNTQNIQNTRNTLNAGYDGFHGGPVSQNAVEWKRPTPEPHIPASGEWKWEGIIAKGGTSICRARCFPVGKVLDMILPEFLDCTARTSLDMLSKHYYQAASSWVVFFVPESDADMAFYNEFMNYLGEKQRAAVAKLDDKTTLFLVPPSDFSEKILKVPGKLSISGVILRLEQPPATADTLPPPPPPPHQRQPERPDPYLMLSHGEASRMSFTAASPSGSYQLQNLGKPRPGTGTMSVPPFHVDNNTQTQDHLLHRQSRSGDFMIPNNQETTNLSNNYRPGSPTYQEPKTLVAATGGIGIQPDQLAQLASFLGNARQSMTAGEEFRQPSSNVMMGLDNNSNSNNNGYNNNNRMTPRQLPSPSPSQHHQHQHQYHPPNPSQQQQQMMSGYHHQHHQQQKQHQVQVGNMGHGQGQSQSQSSGSQGQGNGQEETEEADPQKRLQATLELAATLLKQIQQGKT
ncbi:unnamed protein product [Lactuca saligna]|uniref:RRM domain-containing protein n=1 Tax=Lactuca saligna TaxID=75948 RepID=A0AA36A3L8_LACSI|nr:unnamed protein product [Lactuca saligna]